MSVDLAKMIDRKSFMLGMITAFGECIAGEAKKCAFSPPFYPDDYFILKTEAERIAGSSPESAVNSTPCDRHFLS